MTPGPTVEITADGSATLRSPLHGDTYHSLRGAVGEARHVFIDAGWQRPQRINSALGQELQSGGPVRVLEMGFGTGLNAWLTLEAAERTGRTVEYTAVEMYPVPTEVASRLGYTEDPRFVALHAASWNEWSKPSEGFRLRKLQGSMTEIVGSLDGPFDVVYWDAFAPDTQPELWTAEIFARVFASTAPGGVLVTYSSKGDVRRALQAAGFTVERLPGALGKRHMLRATKMDKKYIFDYESYASRGEMTPTDRTLADRALEACGSAHAPYSNFRVGAAARLRSGRVMTGSNQESEVFPAGMCAERTLLFHWQARHSDDPIEALAIASIPGERECYPCGQCRQVLLDTERRQGSPIRIIMCGESSASVVGSAANLLPFTFTL